MPIKIISIMVLLVVASFGANVNYNGYKDVTAVTDTLGESGTAYSAVFNLSEYEDARLVVKANDTGEAGFASDSVALEYGYQTGSPTLNASGVVDTVWDGVIVIDTMLASDFGAVGAGTSASTGVMTRTWGGADTLSVTGYAVQSRWFVPEWDVLIRFFATGLAANNKDAALDLELEVKRRVSIPTR